MKTTAHGHTHNVINSQIQQSIFRQNMKASSSCKTLDQEVCVEKHKAPTTRCDQQIWLHLDLSILPQPEKEVLSPKQPGCRNLEYKKM